VTGSKGLKSRRWSKLHTDAVGGGKKDGIKSPKGLITREKKPSLVSHEERRPWQGKKEERAGLPRTCLKMRLKPPEAGVAAGKDCAIWKKGQIARRLQAKKRDGIGIRKLCLKRDFRGKRPGPDC